MGSLDGSGLCHIQGGYNAEAQVKQLGQDWQLLIGSLATAAAMGISFLVILAVIRIFGGV